MSCDKQNNKTIHFMLQCIVIIKFQALNESAARTVRKSRCLSCCMLWVTIVAVAVPAIVFAYRFKAIS